MQSFKKNKSKNLSVIAESTISEKEAIEIMITTRNISQVFGEADKATQYF